MTTCQACGTANEPAATYCISCARKLDPDTQQAVAEQRLAHTATAVDWTRILGALFVLVLVILLIVLLVSHVL